MSPFERRILGWEGHSDQAPSGDWLLNSVNSAIFLSTSQISIKEMSQGRETNKPQGKWLEIRPAPGINVQLPMNLKIRPSPTI